MNKKVAQLLRQKALGLEDYLSDINRTNNFGREQFKLVRDPYILSERTAAGIYKKTSGKLALIGFKHLLGKGALGWWQWSALAESHIYGFQIMQHFLYEVEQYNFPYNFEEVNSA